MFASKSKFQVCLLLAFIEEFNRCFAGLNLNFQAKKVKLAKTFKVKCIIRQNFCDKTKTGCLLKNIPSMATDESFGPHNFKK